MKLIIKKMPMLLLALGLAGCSTFTTFLMESRLPDHQIIIDGKTDDWTGNLYFVEGKPIALGLLNDRDDLYICLVAEDNFTRFQIMMQGLTVWFDPQGGKKKTLGITCPIGLPPGERPMPSMGENPEGPGFDNLPGESPTDLEIIRSDKETPQKLKISEAKGIELKAVPSSGLFVYELKIPLVQTEEHPIAVGAEPGKTIGIGFETGKLDMSQIPRRGPGTMPGGGGDMPPMGRGPGRGGMGGFGMEPGRSEGLKIWAIIQLAPGQTAHSPELLGVSKTHN